MEGKNQPYDDDAPLNFDEKTVVWAVALGVLGFLVKMLWEWFNQ
jgi:hypothetical protein